MTSEELKDLFRSEMGDEVEQFLWSDPEVYTYLDDAQRMFCRLTDGIGDARTPAVVEIAVAEGDTWLELHPAIKKIRAATRDSDGRGLTLVNFEDLARRGIRLDNRRCPVTTIVTGMEENQLRIAGVASAPETIRLLVFRLPLTAVSAATADQELEIAAGHHTHLLAWARSRAYLKQDAEIYDEKRAAQFETVFRAYCAQVQREQELKRHKGARTVAYGGI